MHILVVNDDGPPSRKLSPYIRPFVDALQDAGHRVSVAVPAASRSWIGKAHIIGASLTATYVHPDSFREDGSWREEGGGGGGRGGDENEEVDDDQQRLHLRLQQQELQKQKTREENRQQSWVVVSNGTPASCAQLGIYELFPERGEIDLIVSGPNHGRNASTIYNLSSGTVGGALEAATCGKKGIALSFGSKEEQQPEVIRAAARLATRLIGHLWRHWDENVDLYNLNVPMRADVESRPVRYTRALPNVWTKGSLYAEVCGGPSPVVLNGIKPISNGHHREEVDENRHHAKPQKPNPICRHRVREFQWLAELSDIKKSLTESPQGTDARTVLDGFTSVTPLRANFWHPPGFSGELQFDD